MLPQWHPTWGHGTILVSQVVQNIAGAIKKWWPCDVAPSCNGWSLSLSLSSHPDDSSPPRVVLKVHHIVRADLKRRSCSQASCLHAVNGVVKGWTVGSYGSGVGRGSGVFLHQPPLLVTYILCLKPATSTIGRCMIASSHHRSSTRVTARRTSCAPASTRESPRDELSHNYLGR
jgi:hypothetical protein